MPTDAASATIAAHRDSAADPDGGADPALLHLLAQAASPTERITQPWLRPTDPPLAAARFARWLHDAAQDRPERAATILAGRGVDVEDWIAGLGGVAAVAGAPMPAWVTGALDLLDMVTDPRAVAAAGPAPRLGEITGPGLPAGVDPDQPWRFHPGFRVWMGRAGTLVAGWAATHDAALTDSARTDLVLGMVRRLLAVAGPTMMAEAGDPRRESALFAADPGADWRALWARWPVIARLMAVAWEQWCVAAEEVVARIGSDLEELAPGTQVARIHMGQGDQHAGGRTVAALELTDGARLYLKPHPDRIEVLLRGFLRALDRLGEPLGLELPRAHHGPGHVWTWHVGAAECPDAAGVEAWFVRAGALVRVAQVLGATDCHHENLIPTAAGPVLVDLETVLGPAPRGHELAMCLADTPAATSMVTSPVDGQPGWPSIDIGGLAGPTDRLTPYRVSSLVLAPSGPALAQERAPISTGTALPRLAGRPITVGAHVAAVRAGYAEVAARLAAVPDPASLLPEPTGEATARFVPRPTQVYARILQASLAAPALVDGVERDLVLERLWLALGQGEPALIEAEIRSLRELDIPRFTVPLDPPEGPGGPLVLLPADGGPAIPADFALSPLEQAQQRLRAVAAGCAQAGDEDLCAALFAADPVDRGDLAQPLPRPGTRAEPVGWQEPARLLAELALPVPAPGGTAAGGTARGWIGLDHDPSRARWACGRLAPGLLGEAGIGLALILAGDLDLGRQALLASARRVAERPTWTSGDAFTGPSGVLYALAWAGGASSEEILVQAAWDLLPVVLAAARRVGSGGAVAGPTIDAVAGAVLAVAVLPVEPRSTRALAELAELCQRPPARVAATPADRWADSLPSLAAGRALAGHHLASVGLGPPPAPWRLGEDRLTWGDACAHVTLHGHLPAGAWERLWDRAETSPQLLDCAEVARTAHAVTGDPAWAARLDTARSELAARRAGAGRWLAPCGAPDRRALSAVHGMAALTILGLREPGPTLRILR